jgi:CDP-glucose 4,6-dehydratase
MESLVMESFERTYHGRRVLVTGHNGFKGSWMSLWLSKLGADVIGISLPPIGFENHYRSLSLNVVDLNVDVRDFQKISTIFEKYQPEIVFHLAAQPLVNRAYQYPLETWTTNVIGTANVLEACRQSRSVRASVVVTSDKCYEDQRWVYGYREGDTLGGHDPYSASKACAELLTASYVSSFFSSEKGPLIATARGGNVIGGGDWSELRLVPDVIRAYQSDTELVLRNPSAIRPWQHVLDCCNGYLLLGQKLLTGDDRYVGAWNFGPSIHERASVEKLVTSFAEKLSMSLKVSVCKGLHETEFLHLDSSKAFSKLGWRPRWGFQETVTKTAEWYTSWIDSGRSLSTFQLDEFNSIGYEPI